MENNVHIIDVRTYEEFLGGHVDGSKNIPLHELPKRLDEIKSLSGKVILCCASGNRSGQAQHYLMTHGLQCENGGSWLDVNFEMNQI